MYSYKRENEINEIKLNRLVEWLEGGHAGPIQLDAEVHRRCNLNCIACPRRANDFDLNKDSIEHELDKEKWLSLVEEAAKLGVKKFNLEGGGEPTAVPDLIYPIMEKIKEEGMYGIITTNGTLLNEARIKKIVGMDWDRIHFSLDSPTADIHDFLRNRRGAFKKTIDTIKLLDKWKGEENKEHPMLNINIVINKLNFMKLPEMVEIANKLNADYLFTEPLIEFNKVGGKLKIDTKKNKEKLKRSKKRAARLADKYKIDNNFGTEDKNLEEDMIEDTSNMRNILGNISQDKGKNLLSSPCLKPWRLISIKYDGTAGHCGLIQKGESVKNKSLEEIWYGDFLTEVRNKMSRGELLEHCDNCVPSDITQRKRFKRDLKERLASEGKIKK
ncbi:MAG: radical SAM/SPASM domain-containing protein [Candidatus Aenigmatarchaeota archaeon]